MSVVKESTYSSGNIYQKKIGLTMDVPKQITFKFGFAGEANVKQVFLINDGKKKLPVAGCRCTKGTLSRKKRFKLIRDDEEILDGMF